MVNLQAKGRQEAALNKTIQNAHLRVHGYVVFRYDLRRKDTRRDLSLGDAFKYLMKLTGHTYSFWRCPVRGLAMQFKSPPSSKYIYDSGATSRLLAFSVNPDELEAKKEVVLNALLAGLEDWRGLPNAIFDEQTAIMRGLLTAPVSTPAEESAAQKSRLHPQFAKFLESHTADLRANLLRREHGI